MQTAAAVREASRLSMGIHQHCAGASVNPH